MLIVKSMKNKERFDNIDVGEVFSYDDVFYIKASCSKFMVCSEFGVSLSDGKAKDFSPVQVVEHHKDATLTINR